MNTSKKNKQANNQSEFPYMSRHFVERYFERILTKPIPKKFHKGVYNSIKKDMDGRMLEREKNILRLFAKSSEALVPIAKFNKIVVKKNTLITVY